MTVNLHDNPSHNDSAAREGVPGGIVQHAAVHPQCESSAPGQGGATCPVSTWTGADMSGLEFCPKCARSDLALHYYTVPIDWRSNLRCSNCEGRPCSTCSLGVVHGKGDECGRCLLNTVLAAGRSLDLLRYQDCIRLAMLWKNRWSDARPEFKRAYESEADRWCDAAATHAIILGDRVGETREQRLEEIPRELALQTQAGPGILLRINQALRRKLERENQQFEDEPETEEEDL